MQTSQNNVQENEFISLWKLRKLQKKKKKLSSSALFKNHCFLSVRKQKADRNTVVAVFVTGNN